MTKEQKIILLSEFIETKLRKEQELEYYQKELVRITEKIGFLNKELNLTKLIIDMIDHERVLDIEEYALSSKDNNQMIGKD